MFNAHFYAISIEKLLVPHGLAGEHSADEIERNPIEFILAALEAYDKHSSGKTEIINDFYNKYENDEKTNMNNMSEEYVITLCEDLRRIFE